MAPLSALRLMPAAPSRQPGELLRGDGGETLRSAGPGDGFSGVEADDDLAIATDDRTDAVDLL